MADASLGEARQANLNTAGTDMVEISGIAYATNTGAVAAGGVSESGVNAVGAVAVGGGTPHDSVDSGNPIKIGGYGSNTAPTSASAAGDRVNAWFTLDGRQAVAIAGTAGIAITLAPADAAASSIGAVVWSENSGFNGTTWDRLRTTGAAKAAIDASTAGYLAIGQVDSETNFTGAIGPFRDYQTAVRQVLLSDLLSDAVRPDFWTTTNANGGTTTNASGETTVATSANANGSSQITSIQSVPFLPGSAYTYTALVRVSDTGLASNIRRWGVYTVSGLTPQDGYYFELNGTTFQLVYMKAGGGTTFSGAQWSRFTTAPFTLDVQYHRYEITILADYVVFAIDGIVRHVGALTAAAARTATLTLPMTHVSVNTAASATNETLVLRAAATLKLGSPTVSVGDLSSSPNNNTSVPAAGIGPGFDRKTDPAGVAATSTANAVTFVVNGATAFRLHVTTIGVTPGSMIIETTNDDTNWSTAPVVTVNEQYVYGAFVPAVNEVYVVATQGIRQVRYRVNAVYASGTATVKGTATASPLFIRTVSIAPSTTTQTSVTSSATNVTVLAANANRLGATVHNDSTQVVYLLLGSGTASSTNFTVKMASGGYYEIPFLFSGAIKGIWASANGFARVTEIS